VAELVRDALTGARVVHARRGPRVPHAVALTFDDGPSRWTPPILDALGAAGARGTFFVLGLSIEGREATLRRAVAEGHELGNHAYSHTDPATLDDDALRAELERTSEALARVVGRRPTLFRPPYAAYDRRVARVARQAGLTPTVLRSVDPADWRETDHDRIAAGVLAEVRPGSIVCLHDGLPPHTTAGTTDRGPTVAALPAILDGLRERGLGAVTVSELLGASQP
jgi:peptidoglycan/xylan/chitin deacetylase (PgdA/CDA1 family)